ncbi:hypothetical protein [Dongia sp.]|uniref:hypothetical protein n=1 Tax=Dongia sp. TaxID=1977262 RepID=UPI0037502F07
MGTGTASQRHKSRRQQWRERPDEPRESLQRAWRDVNKAHVVFGLALASLAPVAPSAIFIWLTADDAGAFDWIGFLSIFGIATFWFVAGGSLFLFWHGHRTSTVERFDCLSLCASVSALLPAATGLTVAVLTSDLHPPSFGLVLGLAFVGLCLALPGLFGGWLLWRIAIRPAARPLREIAEVF